VDMTQPTHRENLAADEVSTNNQTLLNASIEDIASGKKKVVFAGRA
jgi:hypothetical protein